MGRLHVGAVLAQLWTAGSAVLLFAAVAGILTQPQFPLGLGAIRTRGLAGLWVTFVPAVVGLAGVILLRGTRWLGAGLLLLYSAFWALVIASGLPSIWNAKSSFCLNGLGVCITSPWIGRLTALALLAPFLAIAVWTGRRCMRPTG